MANFIVGIDPDSDRHGVAIYRDGLLEELANWQLIDVIKFVPQMKLHQIKFSIEDVCANNFVYSRNQKPTRAEMSKVGISIGRCQQSQVELIRILNYFGISYALHKPQRGNWSKDKKKFERLTGWNKRSNADTRSAAYFGYLQLKK